MTPYKYALSFDGSASYVAAGTADPVTGSNSMSIGGWLRWNGANPSASSQVLVSKHTLFSSNMRWWVGLDIVNSYKFLIYGDGVSFPFFSYIPPSDGTIIHWVWVHNNGVNDSLYINGAFQSSLGGIAFGAQTGANLQVAASSNGTAEWLNGIQDDVFINTTALTVSQIASIYGGVDPASLAGAWATWKMDEGSGLTTADSTGTNTGTLSGTTTPQWVMGIKPRSVPGNLGGLTNTLRPRSFAPGIAR